MEIDVFVKSYRSAPADRTFLLCRNIENITSYSFNVIDKKLYDLNINVIYAIQIPYCIPERQEYLIKLLQELLTS